MTREEMLAALQGVAQACQDAFGHYQPDKLGQLDAHLATASDVVNDLHSTVPPDVGAVMAAQIEAGVPPEQALANATAKPQGAATE